MKITIQLSIIVFICVFAGSASALYVSDTYGYTDDLIGYDNLGNSSDSGELRFLLGLDDSADVSAYSLLKYEFTEPSDGSPDPIWSKVIDRVDTDADVYAFDFYEFLDGFEPLVYLIKTGAGVTLASDDASNDVTSRIVAPPIPVYDTFKYSNFDVARYAVIDLADFGRNQGNVEIQMVSHISAQAPAPVPEPSTLLLFGSGLVGFAVYRRRKK